MPVLPGAEPFSHDAGTGDIGVLVSHGFTGTPQSMRALGRAPGGRRVHRPAPPAPRSRHDLAGLNRTRFEDWYAAVDAAFTELSERCSKVVVAGLSMGGTLVTRLAEERGAEVGGLMLVNPAFRADDRRLAALPLVKHLVPR